ncbi:MAG: 5'/3'-nucleotidase SurE [Acidimicrobiia bacterium]
MGRRLVAMAGAVTLAVLAGCSSDSKGSSSSTSTTKANAGKLQILVSNDDGYAAEGIDVVVQALRKLPNVKITVVAPATNQSGTGSKTTSGAVIATQRKTKSGYPATAVNGYPADSVSYGLDHVVKAKPQLVVTGINEGQNLGPVTTLSGTVGAAKTAVAAGIPALASSQGLASIPLDYPSAAKLVVDWVTARRAALLAGTAEKNIVSLNVPTCTSGTVRGLKQEPLSGPTTAGMAITGVPDCTSTATTFAGDVEAFLAGFATATELTADGQTVTTSTTWPASG